ncbi:aminotransferase class I/II-fold pyridoxal phosphate-dependent enzyme [Calothrix sp. PCC 6303]|uniref:aminotransferase class I/II-fold pyridoxal phosphate-dependent enzyme n=1 Tax=Calothrix sp. PCC 6303 TaxID=1170562 RepID=UPI0002A04915|nr:aminotransferase class I/II-fold pyridoxal phosphate-dependent enzyme [Calothrix sp. PCC 6303]AFZ00099.1 arginine decarboxylase [Calothrix sp. PCC 6303]
MTNKRSHHETPLVKALIECANQLHAPFYTPGHKKGAGVSQTLLDTFGEAVFRFDLPELTELDNLFAPEGAILAAQELAADIFGAEKTWFLVNGSTCGVEAAILATCGMGDKIILPRNVHSSAIAGLILSGAIPIFIEPEYDPILDIAHSITAAAIAAALEAHPDTKAVMMVYPTYYGVCGDVNAIAKIAHQHHIPLLVDEAHGAHFAFHRDLPISALAAGADITVQSIHKTLGAMTQASMLHLQGILVDSDRVSKALQLVQSTSPSYILMASLDAARQQMALFGESLMSQTLKLADRAKEQISQIPGLSVLESPNQENLSGFQALDKTRLTVNVSGLGLTGFSADEILEEKLNIRSELASLKNVTSIISIGNSLADIEQLIQGFHELKSQFSTTNKLNLEITNITALPQHQTLINNYKISPRQAFFSPTQTLKLSKSIGYISAETICPYPPGIPILIPGEIIRESAIEYLITVQRMGGTITGLADSTLETIRIISK